MFYGVRISHSESDCGIYLHIGSRILTEISLHFNGHQHAQLEQRQKDIVKLNVRYNIVQNLACYLLV